MKKIDDNPLYTYTLHLHLHLHLTLQSLFAPAIAGCDFILLTASPFHPQKMDAREYDMISMPTPNHLFAPETPRGCGSRYHFAAARSTTALISHSNPTSEQSEQSPLAVGTPEGKRNGSEAHQPSEFITAMGPVTAMRIISGNL